MPRDSQGLYTLPLPSVRPGDLIESTWANTTLDDVANALTGSLPRDGTAAMVGPLTLSANPITAARQATTKEYVDSFMAFGSGLAVGAVIAYSGAVAPIGYLLCNGQAVSRATYADLFTAIGTTYGAGNGSTTFNVPNLVGQFIRGREAGRQLGSSQAGMVEAHVHGLSDPGHGHFVNDPGHSHTQLSHTHAVSDPGHGHQMTDKVGSVSGNTSGLMVADSSATETPTNRVLTVNNTTGITAGAATAINQNNLTGITVNTNITGASVVANAGTETRPANIGMDYYIKAVKDASGGGGGGGSTTAANVSFVPGGTIVATNVQAAINELDNETQVALSGKAAVGSATPLINGTATAGTSSAASRQDHVHPTDTTRAPLASPALTGTPTAPTALAGTNSTQIATTAFVTAAVAAGGGGGSTPSDSNPSMNGTASPGVSVNYSRGDHIHPSDTSRAPTSAATATGTSFTPSGTIAANTVQAAIQELDSETQALAALKAPLASPALTGVPTAPTATAGTSTTQLATTAFVAAAVAGGGGGALPSDANPAMNGTAAPGTSGQFSRGDHVHPSDTSRAPLASPALTGVPTSPTAAADTNTTQVATTAFVVGQAGTANPAMNSLAAPGTSLKYARQDHVHPSDTSKAGLAANSFTGVQTFGVATVEKAVAMAANNIDCALGAVYSKTISGATALTVSNPAASGSVSSFMLNLTNGGSATITWWSGMKWVGGTAPVLTAAGRDVLGFFTIDGGTTWSGFVLGKDLK